MTSEVPGCCQWTSDQGEIILPSLTKPPLLSGCLRFGASPFHEHVRISAASDGNAAGSLVEGHELQVGGPTGNWEGGGGVGSSALHSLTVGMFSVGAVKVPGGCSPAMVAGAGGQ